MMKPEMVFNCNFFTSEQSFEMSTFAFVGASFQASSSICMGLNCNMMSM